MTHLDWLIVFVLNGSVIAYGIYLARGTETSSDWFLGGRSLPWWAVGLSMFATNVDHADLVGVTGSTFKEGLHIISVCAVGSVAGGILAAFFVVPTIYRGGFFTNAEYLEARFGPSTRVLSALIQLQYRSSMLGLILWSSHLVLTEMVGMNVLQAWGLIVILVILAGFYTAYGGLRSVAWTDVAQGIVMMIAAVVIFVAIWQAVGGWSGMLAELDRTGRFATIGVLALGFLYLPFIANQQNMIQAFTTLVSVFATPLLVTYLAGVLTPAHRRSGLVGSLVGASYGVIALVDRVFYDFAWLPVWFTSRWTSFGWSILFTGFAIALTTLLLGRQSQNELAETKDTGWLLRSREELPALREHPFAERVPMWLNPIPWAAVCLGGSAWLVFVTYW